MNMQNERERGGVWQRVVRGAGRALLAAVGAPAGVRPHRRGTFLVIVIGTLALLAVLGIVYFAIGQGDRRTSAAVVRADRAADVPTGVASYISQVIADDLFSPTVEPINQFLQPTGNQQVQSQKITTRETWDSPGVSWDARVPQDDASEPDYFSPVGAGTDPWLASTEPVWLNFAGRQPRDLARPHLEQKDWLSLSVLSPDGRFVNLFNLRNNFDAESGIGDRGRNGKPRMTSNLWLYDDQGRPTKQTDFGVQVGSAASLEVPALWATRQRGMFMPAIADYAQLDPRMSPAQSAYPGYQFADTDGDGFFDARWFEMIEARDPNRPRNLLPSDGRFRWFVAARVVDASGLINVNTATDIEPRPTKDFPQGLSLSDVDLRRLLTMQDAYDLYGAGPNGYRQGGDQQAAENYSQYTRPVAKNVGLAAYDAIRRSVDEGRVPAFGEAIQPWTWGSDDETRAQRKHDYYWQFASTALAAFDADEDTYTLAAAFPIADTVELMTRRGVNDPDQTSRLERVVGGRLTPNDPQTARYSPLRDNRPLAVEAGSLDVAPPAGQADPDALLQAATDPRRRVTTFSGARDLRWREGSTTGISNEDLKRDAAALARADSPLELFRTYADALLPLSNLRADLSGGTDYKFVAWKSAQDVQDFERCRTLFYGHNGPETALHISAHLALNMSEVFDPTSPNDAARYRGHTLLVDRDVNKFLGTLTAYPELLVHNDGEGRVAAFPSALRSLLTLDRNSEVTARIKSDFPTSSRDRLPRLAMSEMGHEVTAPAVTIYPIMAQPFITQVASFTVYTDAPGGAGGGDRDNVWRDDGQPGDEPKITIDGRVAEANSDFLFRAVAMQLHNPFDVALSLGDQDSIDLNSINPREMPAFHYLRARTDQAGTDDWLALAMNQDILAPAGQVLVRRITVPPRESVTLLVLSQTPRAVARRMARVADNPAYTEAQALQDLSSWAKRQGAGGRVFFAPRVNESFRPTADFNELADTTAQGQVIQLWRVQRSPTAAVGQPQLPGDDGALPNHTANDQLLDRFRLGASQTLDRRLTESNERISGTIAGPQVRNDTPNNDNSGWTLTLWQSYRRPDDPNPAMVDQAIPAYCIQPKRGGTWLTAERDTMGGDSPVTLSGADFRSSSSTGTTFDGWVSSQLATPNSSKFASEPKQNSGSPIGSNRFGQSFSGLRQEWYLNFRAEGGPFKRGGGVGGSEEYTLRPADIFLPMGVGPSEAPIRGIENPSASDRQLVDYIFETDPDRRYTTLSEALAIAFGYEDGVAAASRLGVTSLYDDQPQGAAARRPVLDGGRLRLDDFVPFFDENRDQKFTTGNNTAEWRFGLGIPIALNLLEQFSTLTDEQVSLYRPVLGRVNVNTVTALGARTLGVLSPPDANRWGSMLDPRNNWWWGQAGTQLNEKSDIAATLLSYRDKVDAPFRQASRPTPADIFAVSYHDSDGVTPLQSGRWDGRFITTQIPGIREEPGLRSVGELMCLIQRDPANRFAGPLLANPNNIDFLGFNGADSTERGVDSVLYGAGRDDVDTVTDEFDERFAVLSSVLNTVSTRSDVFVAYFMIHGYLRSDCEGLNEGDPLVPSVKRRFMMIIDRSSVTVRGQRPRVLLFKEVPV